MPVNAPLAVFAFKRLDTLTRVLSSLELCVEFASSPITIFCDQFRPAVNGEKEKVARVRQFVTDWASERNCRVVLADRNLGLRGSITAGVTQMVNEYGRVIVVEDDIVVSPCFLEYMNAALDKYAAHERIFQVCGYMVPHRLQLSGVGLVRVGTCWGWGTWKRAWDYYSDDASSLLSQMSESARFNFDLDGMCSNSADLAANASGALNTWAVRWDASIYLRGGLSVLPGVSLTRNIGFGLDGTHCSPSRVARTLETQRLQRKCPTLPDLPANPREAADFVVAIQEYNRWQSEQWSAPGRLRQIIGRLKRVILRMFRAAKAGGSQ